jgi:transposase
VSSAERAHLGRDLVAAVERGGAGAPAATKMLGVYHDLFESWHRFTGKQIRRWELRRAIEPLQGRMHQALEEGAASGQEKTAGLCRALLKREAALWRFAATAGLEPTNNLAERMLRPAVIWRKKSFGSSSLTGCHYLERMLSVIETLRLRGQATLAYLADAITAHRRGEAPASIPPRAARTTTPPPPNASQDLRKVA